ncbi:MAG: hypothetical protein AAF211_12975 [Myxococcota bacterium]
MSRWLPLAAIALGILLAGIGARLYFSFEGGPRCDQFEAVTLSTLPPDPACVQLEAQAHYDVVLKQTRPGNLFVDERTIHMFPLFPPDALDERGIRVFVLTERAPERLVNLETMAVSGFLTPLTPADVPIGAEAELGRRGGYFFEDFAMVLVPQEIRSGDEVWTRP